MEQELKDYRQGQPGHGEPRPPLELLRQTRSCIEELRRQVQKALPETGTLTAVQVEAIKQALVTQFPHGFDTLLLPFEHEANIQATARELAAKRKGR